MVSLIETPNSLCLLRASCRPFSRPLPRCDLSPMVMVVDLTSVLCPVEAPSVGSIHGEALLCPGLFLHHGSTRSLLSKASSLIHWIRCLAIAI